MPENNGESAAIDSQWLKAPNLHAGWTGSIHDEEAARRAGLPAPPIGANTLLAYYNRTIVNVLGREFYERGFMQLDFLAAIYESHSFRISVTEVQPTPDDARLIQLSMERSDGVVANTGFAGIAIDRSAAVPPWERAGAPPTADSVVGLDVLPNRPLGSRFAGVVRVQAADTAAARQAAGDDCSWYESASPWGGAIVPMNMFHNLGLPEYAVDGGDHSAPQASPSASPSRAAMNSRLQLLMTGPIFAEERYRYSQVLIEKGFSRTTAFSTAEYTVEDLDGSRIAIGRQKLRWFIDEKGSRSG